MDAVKQGHGIVRLVGLQLAHMMQFDAWMSLDQRRPLGLGFLHPVFPEDALPGLDQRRDAFRRVSLADGDKSDLVHLAPGDPGGGGDAIADFF